MTAKKKHSFFYLNSLSIVMLGLAFIFLFGQAWTGHDEYNEHLAKLGEAPVGFAEYFTSGHFLQATFENWESEFFQMALFVLLTVYLRQRGSSESKLPEDEIMDPNHLKPGKNSPWPVKKGGIWLTIYKYSLTIAMFLLFLVSFVIHWYGSWKDFCETQALEGKTTVPMLQYLGNRRFWFESFQNWQSEFLSVFAIVFLSIYLRQIGSPQSKPVNSPHYTTKG